MLHREPGAFMPHGCGVSTDGSILGQTGIFERYPGPDPGMEFRRSYAAATLAAVDVFRGPLPVERRFEVQTSAGRPTMATGSDLRFGYIDVTASAGHIHALFSGCTRAGFPDSANFGRFVHVFDWNANFEWAFEMDAAVLTIALDRDGRYEVADRRHTEGQSWSHHVQ